MVACCCKTVSVPSQGQPRPLVTENTVQTLSALQPLWLNKALEKIPPTLCLAPRAEICLPEKEVGGMLFLTGSDTGGGTDLKDRMLVLVETYWKITLPKKCFSVNKILKSHRVLLDVSICCSFLLVGFQPTEAISRTCPFLQRMRFIEQFVCTY